MIAFQEQRFRTYVQFTHEIQPAPVDLLWQQMRNKTRNVIRRAKEQISIEQILDPEEFIRAHKNNLAAEGENDSLDMDACRRVLSAALARKQGRILAARNSKGEIVAANFCAWDNTTAFYVLSTRSSRRRQWRHQPSDLGSDSARGYARINLRFCRTWNQGKRVALCRFWRVSQSQVCCASVYGTWHG